MRLDVRNLHPCRARQTRQRANLVQHHRFHLRSGQVHVAPAKTLQVRIARVRANGRAVLRRQPYGGRHHQRIAGVVSAGDVG